MSDDDPHGHESVLRRQVATYRAAADKYEIGAKQLRQMADEIEARDYQPEPLPEGWMSVTTFGELPPGWVSHNEPKDPLPELPREPEDPTYDFSDCELGKELEGLEDDEYVAVQEFLRISYAHFRDEFTWGVNDGYFQKWGDIIRPKFGFSYTTHRDLEFLNMQEFWGGGEPPILVWFGPEHFIQAIKYDLTQNDPREDMIFQDHQQEMPHPDKPLEPPYKISNYRGVELNGENITAKEYLLRFLQAWDDALTIAHQIVGDAVEVSEDD